MGDNGERRHGGYEQRCSKEAGRWGKQKIHGLWLHRRMMTDADTRGDECSGSTYEVAQERAYWEGKC